MPSNAHRSAPRESLARGCAALLVSCRHTCPQPVQRYRRIVSSSVVGRHPSGSCASLLVTVSRGLPSQPQRRHQRVRLLDRVVGDPAGQHRPIRLQVLADHHQTQLVEAAERRHIRGREGSVRHVEVFLASLKPLRDLSYEPPQVMDRGRLGRRTKT